MYNVGSAHLSSVTLDVCDRNACRTTLNLRESTASQLACRKLEDGKIV
jgi:hypothetical protein